MNIYICICIMSIYKYMIYDIYIYISILYMNAQCRSTHAPHPTPRDPTGSSCLAAWGLGCGNPLVAAKLQPGEADLWQILADLRKIYWIYMDLYIADENELMAISLKSEIKHGEDKEKTILHEQGCNNQTWLRTDPSKKWDSPHGTAWRDMWRWW